MIITETKRYAACPECGGKAGLLDQHLDGKPHTVGPWACDDCGRFWMIATNGIDSCEMKLDGTRRSVPATVTLALPPQKEPIVLTLHDSVQECPGEEFGEGSDYFYDEHTCPTNWMHNVVEIRIGDDADPHGLFEFQKIERGHIERSHDCADEGDEAV